MAIKTLRSLHHRRDRRGEGAVNGVLIGIVVIVAAACYLGATFVPTWMDQLAYRECATVGLLEYIETESEDAAYQRMDKELTDKGVQEWVSSGDCTFDDPPVITCSTTFYAYYPGTDAYKSFPYDVTITMEGGKPVVR